MLKGKGADVVAIIERNAAHLLQPQHALHVARHGVERAFQIRLGIALAQLQRLLQRHAVGHVAVQRIVRRSLVGKNVRQHAALGQLRNHVGAVSHQPDGDGFFLAHGILHDAQRFIQRVDHEVAIAGLQALLDALGIDLDSQEARAGHRGRQRLSAAHAAHAAADDQLACQVAAKMFFRRRGKGLKRSLDDSLRADVDPRAGRHLPVHHQPGAFQFVELLPVGPVADKVGVGDQHARRVVVRFEDPHGLAGLHQQRLVVFQRLQRGDDGVKALLVARGFARAAINHQVVRTLGHVIVKVVHEHAHGGFLRPCLAREIGATRSFERRQMRSLNFSIDRHREMVANPCVPC